MEERRKERKKERKSILYLTPVNATDQIVTSVHSVDRKHCYPDRRNGHCVLL